MNIQLVNENSLIIYFGDAINRATADNVAWAYHLLHDELAGELLDITPAYTSILLCCDLQKIDVFELKNRVRAILQNKPQLNTASHEGQILELPVYYGEEVALDHQVMSEHTGLPFNEIVQRHSSQVYQVFAIGFTPGFAYLGNVDAQIAMPRKANPRLKVPKGSVAIADRQTAVYPKSSPGGWQIIGRTPLELFDPGSANLCPFEVGANVQFKPIDRLTFLNLGGQLDCES